MEVQARRCLTHPMWLGALLLLVVNDHVLKGAELLPGWMTGKLSDVAGMLVAPALLAVLLRLKTRRGFALAHLAVGLSFAAINVSPPLAALVELVSSYTPFPWAITVDPTDLVALPALVISYRMFARRGDAPLGRLRLAEAAALLVGGVACMATSEPCDECVGPPGVSPVAEEQASLTIGNTTDSQLLVRVRRLRPEVQVNCQVLLADPTSALSRDLFGPAEAWLLEPGRALPLQNGSCASYLVDAQGLEMTLLAWDEADYPTRVLPTSTDQPSEQMLMLRMTSNGRLELDDHPAIFDAPSVDPSAPAPHCALPDETSGIDWTETVNYGQRIIALESAADGCHRIETDRDVIYVCLPLPSLPFVLDEQISVAQWDVSGSYPESSAENGGGVGIEIVGSTTTLRAVRGNTLARKNASTSYDSTIDYGAEAEEPSGCDWQHDSCGSAIAPLSVSLLGAGISGVVSLGAGESAALDDETTLYLVKAQRMPIRDTACTPQTSRSEIYFESVLVWQTEQL